MVVDTENTQTLTRSLEIYSGTPRIMNSQDLLLTLLACNVKQDNPGFVLLECRMTEG